MNRNLLPTILFLIIFTLALPVCAQQEERPVLPATIEIGNSVIDNIVGDIYDASDKVYELKQFSISNITTNKWGFKEIYFKERLQLDEDREPLHFGINIVPIAEMGIYDDSLPSVHYTFPFLGIKIVTFQDGETRRRQFDITTFIKKHGILLSDHQQGFMPFRMDITSPKQFYRTGEPISFTVRLTNASNVNMQANGLRKSTLYLKINDATWGSPKGPEQKEYFNEIMIRPGDHIERKFDISAPPKPGTLRIFGIYHMSFEGVSPSAVLELDITR